MGISIRIRHRSERKKLIVYSKQLPAQRDSLVVFNKGAPTGKLKERDTLPSHVTASQKVRTRRALCRSWRRGRCRWRRCSANGC